MGRLTLGNDGPPETSANNKKGGFRRPLTDSIRGPNYIIILTLATCMESFDTVPVTVT
jgi:hypothetical protein